MNTILSLVLSHFKGHPMGGYGGALKQLSIGIASSAGKSWIHSAGFTLNQNELWDNIAEPSSFISCITFYNRPINSFYYLTHK